MNILVKWLYWAKQQAGLDVHNLKHKHKHPISLIHTSASEPATIALVEALGVLLVVPLEVLLGVPQVALQMVPVVVVEAVVQGFLVVVVVLVVGKDSSNPVVGSILPTLVCNLAGLLVALW